MISAHEARQHTLMNIKSNKADQLAMIEKEINESIKRGKFCYSGQEYLYDETIEELENNGYLVTLKDYLEYTISWEKG